LWDHSFKVLLYLLMQALSPENTQPGIYAVFSKIITVLEDQQPLNIRFQGICRILPEAFAFPNDIAVRIVYDQEVVRISLNRKKPKNIPFPLRTQSQVILKYTFQVIT
jgi:hypothetical protein